MNVHAYIYCQLQTCNCNLQAQYHKLNTAEMGNFFFFVVCYHQWYFYNGYFSSFNLSYEGNVKNKDTFESDNSC